jgi:2-polyprenyl-3-methyl-5-hydroxy-6-metoxy-1,4-benzoquinol methylase
MSFDYSKIPNGFYDNVLTGPDGMRKFWHYHKFESVLRYIPSHLFGIDKRILDIGCFGGSFLGMIPESLFSDQVGVDILSSQIEYATKRYGTTFRSFRLLEKDEILGNEFHGSFHVITLIEVIEHLSPEQIFNLLNQISKLLHPEGKLIITTPNYLSTWPLIEYLLNHFSDIHYEEQHLSKFNYFMMESKIRKIAPDFSLRCEDKTTTHLLSPFIAALSYKKALEIATAVPSAYWKNPFGNIILSRWSW